MRKTFLKVSLLAVLGLGMSASFTSCKDYDGDIDNLQDQINQLNSKVAEIEAAVKGGAVITNVAQNGDGITFTLSNGQNYTVKNGKDGAAGKDADVWTIVKNAEGEYVWAKNGTATEYPAQGPAGEDGTALPGVYYKPAANGFFVLVDPATGKEEPTDIKWKGEVTGGLTAIADGDKVIISGIVNDKGEAQEDITLYRSIMLKGLVVMPELYLNGIEATRFEKVATRQAQVTVNAPVGGVSVAKANATEASATIAAGQPMANKGALNQYKLPVYWTANTVETLKYRLNPNDAALPELNKWEALFSNIEVAFTNRAEEETNITNVEKTKDGNLLVSYKYPGSIAPGATAKLNATIIVEGEVVGEVEVTTSNASKPASVTKVEGTQYAASETQGEDPKFKYKKDGSEIEEEIVVEKTVLEKIYREVNGVNKAYWVSVEKNVINPNFNIGNYGKDTEQYAFYYNNVVYNVANANASWTFMALQAEVDTATITSDNVAILLTNVDLNGIYVDKRVQAAATAEAAIQSAASSASATTTVTIPAAYNTTFDLAKHLSVNVSKLTPMVDNKLSNNTNQEPQSNFFAEIPFKAAKNGFMSLEEVEAAYGLKAAYQLVTYTVAPNETSEDMFAQINAETGVITPCYVNNNGQSVAIPGTTQGRSAIGRRPMVYVTLSDAEKGIVLAGFVRVIYTEPTRTLDAIVLGDRTIPYVCNYQVGSNWEQITSLVYEQFGLTPTEFAAYKLQAGGVPFVEVGGNLVAINSAAYKNAYGYNSNFGTFFWDENIDGSHTQKLTFQVTKAQYGHWYPYKWGNSWRFDNPKSNEVTKTLYAQLYNENNNSYIYLGFNVTVNGTPAAEYDGKLYSSWSQNFTVTPINPAVPGQTKVIGGKLAYAQVMGMNFRSAWKGGEPAPVAKTDYNWTGKEDSPYLLGKVTANYSFNGVQPEVKGVSGATYKLGLPVWLDDYTLDVQALYALKQNEDGTYPTEDDFASYDEYVAAWQPIAAITATEVNANELDVAGGNFATAQTNTLDYAAGVWNRIDMLSVYWKATSSDMKWVVTPAYIGGGLDAGEWVYAAYACDIVNAKPYDFNNPAILFNVDMTVSYTQINNQNGEDGKYTCILTIPAPAPVKVGVGRPLALNNANTATIQDAATKKILASQLFKVADWQGKLLWNATSNGNITANTSNGVNNADFWLSTGDFTAVQWPVKNADGSDIDSWLTKSSFRVAVGEARVGATADFDNNMGKLNEIYVDKQLEVSKKVDEAKIDIDKDTRNARVFDYKDLKNLEITWVNDGNSVTENIYIFVPIYVTYIWGEDIFLGNAVITITPTLQGN